MRATILLACLGLSACATVPPPAPQIVYRDNPVVVTEACKPDHPPQKPDYVDTDQALAKAPDMAERAKLYVIGRWQRVGYIGELEAALNGCMAQPNTLR
jgi:hypothetical protein